MYGTRLLAMIIMVVMAATTHAAPRTIHVFVALCDNVNQGIVPVPASLGNGRDPGRNLYWGALYGVKTLFSKSTEWERVVINELPTAPVLDRVLFRNRKSGDYLLAEAYDGAHMRSCIADHLNALAGHDTVHFADLGTTIHFGGGADLVCFVGHNGLMDFTLDDSDVQAAAVGRTAIAMVLCCYSERYFNAHVLKANGTFSLGTRGLMAPEAYVLHAAVNAWMLGKNADAVREAAAQAYNVYQKCGIKGARGLFGAKAGN